MLLIVAAITGCKPSAPKQGGGAGGGQALSYGFTLSQSEFNGLSAEEQFMVANKALSTLYRGVPADEFFDLTQGLESPVIQQNNFIIQNQIALQTPLDSEELDAITPRLFGVVDNPATTEVDESIAARFRIDGNHPHQYYMARIQTYPISRDMFVNWMAYFLANTIMFSPAREMDSTNNQDITRVLGYLEKSLTEETSIRDTIRGWLHNLSRWRVSRSPENHALEMFELYLGVFNDTPEEQQNTLNGGRVCDSWYLTDNDADYQLLPDPVKPEGTETLKVFGKYVSTCDDLYDVVAGHPLVIPRVVEVIVNYFMDGSPAELKTRLIQDIVNTGPTRFDDVFLAIIFSEAFLLHSERPKTFEENAFNFLHAMHWTPRSDSGELDDWMMDRLLDSNRFDSGADIGVHRMGWAAMDYKIGRTPFLPMDVLSFATYHKAMRESVLLNERAFDGCNHPGVRFRRCYQTRSDEELALAESDPNGLEPFPIHNGSYYEAGTENLKPELEGLTASEFVDFVFLTALGRRADEQEKNAFLEEASQGNRDYIREYEGVLQLRKTSYGDELWENRTDDFGEIMLDYISRLPEFYYYKAAN
jgi:hypothetical protein